MYVVSYAMDQYFLTHIFRVPILLCNHVLFRIQIHVFTYKGTFWVDSFRRLQSDKDALHRQIEIAPLVTSGHVPRYVI
jgi:hypothetical protein